MPTTITTTPEAAKREMPPSPWMRLSRGASITMVLWSVVLQATAGAVIPPVLVIGASFLLLVPFLRGQRRRLGLALAPGHEAMTATLIVNQAGAGT